MKINDQKVIACAEELQDECDEFIKEVMEKKPGGNPESAAILWYQLAIARVMVAQEEISEQLEDVKARLPKRF